jgi:hypothetical protein
MRAYLRHEKEVLPLAARSDGAPRPFFGPTVVVLPAVVEERDAGVERLVNDSFALVVALRIAEVMPPEADRRDLRPGLPERAL